VHNHQYAVAVADRVARWLGAYVVITLILAGGVLVFSSVALADTRPRATNAEVQEAYNLAPLITNRQARAVPPGITPRQLFRRMHGVSFNATNRFHGRTWKICITYPIRDTGVKDARLGVIADEWTFCFPFNNRLERKFFWNA
jgi:hypothetical protein